jgi:glycosyltransferase involved in cell wall biosynthesis
MKKIFLITSEFPFGKSETFLETEIEILSVNFDEIIIFPINEGEKKRETPKNCTVITNKKINKGYLTNILFLFNIISKKKHLIKNEYKNLLPSKNFIKKNKILIASLINSLIIKNHIELFFKNKNIKDYLFYSYWCDDSAIALAMLKEEKKIDVAIARAHRWDIYFEENKYNYLPLREYILSKLNQIFPISENGKKYIDTHWKGEIKTTISRLGVKNQETLCPKSVSDDNSILIVSCSTTKPVKRINLIIDSLKEIKKFKVNWVHFGDGKELEDLKKAALCKLPQNISTDWRGSKLNHEILEFYQKNNPDIFINVSSSEGIPVSIMEAYSFGIPCIATNVGGTNEIVNNENGFLLSPNPKTSEITNAIEMLAKMDDIEFNSYKKHAKTTQLNKFSAIDNYNEFYRIITKNLL